MDINLKAKILAYNLITMFPRISDLINYLFDTSIDLPVQTYGFFLALAFLFAAMILRVELKRKELDGKLEARIVKTQINKPTSWIEITFGALLSALIGYKLFGIIFEYPLFVSNPQSYLLSSKGSPGAAILIVLISIGYALFRNHQLSKREEIEVDQIIHPYQQTWNILIVAIISALVGSKLFDIIDNFGYFLNNPIKSLISFSGLTFYGGLIVTVIVLIFYMRVIKLDWKYVIDATAPAIMLGYALGRMGCHLSGDGCWGIVNLNPKPEFLYWLPDWAWANNYPHNVVNEGIHISGCLGSNCTMLEYPVWPTSLYESLISFLFFGILWSMRKKLKSPVTLFGLFMIQNGIERFLIEKIRVNNRFSLLGLHPTQAEVISTLLIILGTLTIWYFHSANHKTTT